MHLILLAESYPEQLEKFRNWLKKFHFKHPRRCNVAVREFRIFDIVYRKGMEEQLLETLKAISNEEGEDKERKKDVGMLRKLVLKFLPIKPVDLSKVKDIEWKELGADFWAHLYILGTLEDSYKDGEEKV